MQSPGISTRPITLISGASPFCEVFFEDVQIPKANVVDEVNRGWTVAKALLGYERTMIGQAISGQLAGSQDSLVALARRHLDSPQGPLPKPHLRAQIARNAMNERAFMYTLQRIQQAVRDGRAPGPESSITKVYGASLKQDRWELAVSIAGEASLGWEGPGFDDEDLDNTRQWLRSRANSIEGGSSEIQLNIIAKRVLGLPSS